MEAQVGQNGTPSPGDGEGEMVGADGLPLSGKQASRKKYAEATVEAAYQLYAEGKELADIGEVVGVPHATISKWSSKYGWKARMFAHKKTHKKASLPRNKPKLELAAAMRQNVSLEIRPTDFDPKELDLSDQQSEYRRRMAAQALRVPELMESLDGLVLLQCADKLSKLDSIARKALNLEGDQRAPTINIRLVEGWTPEKEVKTIDVDPEFVGELSDVADSPSED
jgi:hypothetical protein